MGGNVSVFVGSASACSIASSYGWMVSVNISEQHIGIFVQVRGSLKEGDWAAASISLFPIWVRHLKCPAISFSFPLTMYHIDLLLASYRPFPSISVGKDLDNSLALAFVRRQASLSPIPRAVPTIITTVATLASNLREQGSLRRAAGV